MGKRGAMIAVLGAVLLLGVLALLPTVDAQRALECGGQPVTLQGTTGNDVLRGTNGVDVIHGRGGNDKIIGRGGDDIICGGKGRDNLIGGGGDDQLFGDAGRDRLRGGPGVDALDGGRGNDRCVPNGRDWMVFCEAPSLKRGINLAGDFEVEPRGSWGTAIEPGFFALAAEAGFDHVRIPIRWSSHTGPAPSYEIDEEFAQEVDALISEAARYGLTIIIDVHHFEELDVDPAGERAHFLSIWDQLGRRYANQPDTVVFELLNEPIGVFADQPEVWNDLLAEGLDVVRQTNPDRTVIVGPVSWNHPSRLQQLVLPDDDNLVVTIHSYDPGYFTNQGAEFTDADYPTGVRWAPSTYTVDYGWNFFHWAGSIEEGRAGLDVTYDDAFSAINFERLDAAAVPFNDHATLFIEADSALDDALILCRPAGAGSDAAFVESELDGAFNSDDVWEGSASLAGCAGTSSIAIQSPTGDRTIRFWGVGLCGPSGCEELVVTNKGALQAMFASAAAWAEANDVELHLGEFGVYNAPDEPVHRRSRSAWIKAMRKAAERHDIGWAYFELSSEFGAYDHDRDRWRPGVLEALLN